jgi:hypothetical protein
MQFQQPDTIIPELFKPQALNRYSYVYNRPNNLSDPSGHCGEGSVPSEGISQEQHDWSCALRDEALRVSEQVHNGSITDNVEGLARVVEFAVPHYQKRANILGASVVISEDKRSLAYDLGVVLGGLEYLGDEQAPRTVLENHGGLGGLIADLRSGDTSIIDVLGEVGGAVINSCRGTDSSYGRLCQYYTGFDAFGTSGFRKEYYERG